MFKKMFSTTKRTVISIVCIVAAVALLCGGTVFAATMVSKSTAIGEENALYFACANAGADPAAVANVKVDFDFEQGQFVYDVEFDYDSVEYSYWIKASDGSIVKKEVELADGTEIVDIANGTSASTEATTAPAESNTEAEAPADDPASSDSSNETAAPQETSGTATADITLAEAKDIALKDAGLSESSVSFTKTKEDYDDGNLVYEVDFYNGSIEYEYTISLSGTILGKEVDRDSEGHPLASSSTTSTQAAPSTKATTATTAAKATEQATAAPSQGQISLEEAKAAALSDAGLSASQVTITKAKADYDDGQQVYEIKFNTDTTKYEYTISASGAILERDVDQKATTSASSQSQLSLAEAKAIALKDAGLSESQVTMKKAKLDRDDGQDIYEIEFESSTAEYEYEINASTGAIIDKEVEEDD